ncbi:hypothetical protein [Arthrobacter sp. H14]|uniref:hypothetical protein n=1 Tax=Arthrobacter sp. H14 TaxID=1312959 RepID=UPI0004B8A3A7|nr:hypothetical protein [Arthrobacter sp. H14]
MLLGFLAGNSYEAVAKAAGRDITALMLVVALIAFITFRVHTARRERGPSATAPGSTPEGGQ